MDIICSSSKYENGIYAEFKDVFYTVGYENPLAKSGKSIRGINDFLFCEIIYIYIYMNELW